MPRTPPRLVPPRGRRPWRVPDHPEATRLQYLGWGRRCYGRDPLPITRQVGYVYLLVRGGVASLDLPGRSVACGPGTACILDPRLPMGWGAPDTSPQEIFVSIWIDPPSFAALRPGRDGLIHWGAGERVGVEIARIFRRIRSELAVGDAYSAAAVAAQQKELDLVLARSLPGGGGDLMAGTVVPADGGFAVAQRWVDAHLDSPRPVADLCDRMALSRDRLNRLFRCAAGVSPSEWIGRRKLDAAREMLAGGTAVKEVAIRLGYRHAHDFLRFFRKGTGTTPSSVTRRTDTVA